MAANHSMVGGKRFTTHTMIRDVGEGENFHELSYSQLFKGKFSQIIMDCKEYLSKVSISRVKFSRIVFDP